MARIIDIEGIGPANQKKLLAAGIKTTDGMIKAAGSAKDRKALAEKTGIKESSLLEWVNRSDLFRVKGVGTQYSDLLEAAGVDSALELSKRRADNLTKAMAEINAKGKNRLVRQLPSETQVGNWITHAKTLKKVVSH
jgi:predicted flap endonuclease-1-like 5' DNA nuclease